MIVHLFEFHYADNELFISIPPLRTCQASVILSDSEESGGHISYTLSYLRSFTPPVASFRMTTEQLRS